MKETGMTADYKRSNDKPKSAVSVPVELFEANAKSIRARIAEIAFCKLIGSEVDELGPGTCTASVARRPELVQYLGMFHGGVIAYLVDHSTTVAVCRPVDKIQREPAAAVAGCNIRINPHLRRSHAKMRNLWERLRQSVPSETKRQGP